MLKTWHYLNYKGHFYLCLQRKANTSFRVYKRFWKVLEVSQACNMLHLLSGDAVHVSPFCSSVFTIPSGNTLDKHNEPSLTGAHIIVSLTLNTFQRIETGLKGQHWCLDTFLICVQFSATK